MAIEFFKNGGRTGESMKYVIWGFGAVGQSFTEKLKENHLFDANCFYCIDSDKKAKTKFMEIGGIETHFQLSQITKDNFIVHLEQLSAGDYLLDFCTNVNNLQILSYCLEHEIHYFSTADGSWDPDPSWISDHQHYVEYQKIKRTVGGEQNTCMVLFGMNPGMVSCFAKQCLKEIVTYDDSEFIKSHRNKLQQLLNVGEYGKVCKQIGVTEIFEIDNDNQITNISAKADTCYSTWNCKAYYDETVASPEIAFGRKNEYKRYNNYSDCDSTDLYLAFQGSGLDYLVKACSPQGETVGHLSAHEEVFPIRQLFSYKDYKPTVCFIYSPCELADESIRRFRNNLPEKHCLVARENIVEGGESVGIVIQGKKFKPRYYGNLLETNQIGESATILQVSASAYAAFVYMLKHNRDGLIFPEDVDENEILSTAKVYLKEYISDEYPEKIELKVVEKHE